jgi:hypothetical protein
MPPDVACDRGFDPFGSARAYTKEAARLTGIFACASYFIYRPQITGTIVLNTPFFARMKKVE